MAVFYDCDAIMPERDEPLNRHLSAADLAEYFHTECPSLGRTYKTHGEVWACNKDERLIGLLHLILTEMRKHRESINDVDSELQAHRSWLTIGKPKVDRVNAKHERQCSRIARMLGCSVDVLFAMRNTDFGNRISENLAMWWFGRKNNDMYLRTIRDTESSVKRLKLVRTAKDLIKLKGVGRKGVQKLISAGKSRS